MRHGSLHFNVDVQSRVVVDIFSGDEGYVGKYTGHNFTAEALFVPGVIVVEFESDHSGSDLGFKLLYTAVGE